MRLPKYVYPDRSRHGKVRYYMCRGRNHRKFRVIEEIGSPEFYASYIRFLKSGSPFNGEAESVTNPHEPATQSVTLRTTSPDSVPGTLGWLFQQYRASTKWRDLGSSTKYSRGLVIDRISNLQHPRRKGQNWGECPLDAVGPMQIKEIRDANLGWRNVVDPETGEATEDVEKFNIEGSNSWLRVLRSAFAWAFNDPRMNLQSNPTIGISLYPASVEGFHCWSLAEIQTYRDRHPVGTVPRLAFEILFQTGQRRSDAVRIGKGLMDLDSKGRPRFKFTQVKNMRTARPTIAVVPYWPELQAIVKATPEAGDQTFLAQANGSPYTPESLGNMFREWCDEAHLPNCSAHGLRKAFVVEMIRQRRRPSEVMAVTGHTTQKEFDRYARSYLRENAAEQLLDDWILTSTSSD